MLFIIQGTTIICLTFLIPKTFILFINLPQKPPNNHYYWISSYYTFFYQASDLHMLLAFYIFCRYTLISCQSHQLFTYIFFSEKLIPILANPLNINQCDHRGTIKILEINWCRIFGHSEF